MNKLKTMEPIRQVKENVDNLKTITQTLNIPESKMINLNTVFHLNCEADQKKQAQCLSGEDAQIQSSGEKIC